MTSTVLVVEDDPAVRQGLVDALQFAGHQVVECAEGDTALRAILGADLDLILLDVMLPGVDGFQLLDEVRRTHPTLPVIMVTARGAEDDRVRGLRSGADDYIVKPFSARELLARVDAVLRRSPERPLRIRSLEVDGCRVHFERREAVVNGEEPRQLSEKEVEILAYLAASPGRAISREELLQRVWGLNPRGLETRTVDMHIARLREKLGDSPGAARIILTVRSKGYMLVDTVEIVES